MFGPVQVSNVRIPISKCGHLRCSIANAIEEGIVPVHIAAPIMDGLDGNLKVDDMPMDETFGGRVVQGGTLFGDLLREQIRHHDEESARQNLQSSNPSDWGGYQTQGTAMGPKIVGDPTTAEDPNRPGVEQFYTEKEKAFLEFLKDLRQRPTMGQAPPNMLSRPDVQIDDGILLLLKTAFMAGYSASAQKVLDMARTIAWDI